MKIASLIRSIVLVLALFALAGCPEEAQQSGSSSEQGGSGGSRAE
jgi:predicted small lipoprotein YifL